MPDFAADGAAPDRAGSVRAGEAADGRSGCGHGRGAPEEAEGGGLKIGDCRLKSPFLTAPLAGVTDSAYRGILAEMGAALTTTEMVSAKGLIYGNKKTEELLAISPEEGPVSYQLFGAEPEIMAEAVRGLAGRPHRILDINMGCPVPKVVKNGEGSALLKDLDRLYDVAAAAVKNAGRPVTVKIRTGWDAEHIVAAEAARAAQAAGCAAVTVHGRTREQFYSGRADWDEIARVRAAVDIPVIGNGDIFTAQDALDMMHQTGCAMVMIARGCLGNPWIFREADALWRYGEKIPGPTDGERRSVMRRHLERLISLKGERRAVMEMRKHAAWYVRGMAGANRIRQAANGIGTADEMIKLIDSIGTR